MTANEAATQVCHNLVAELERIAVPEMGKWAQTWEIVGPADAAFMAELLAWEGQPTQEAQARVRHAYTEVVEAWRGAVRQFQNAHADRESSEVTD